MLPAFRGRYPFRQYMPNKPSKYGLKIFAMADSKTFYVSNMEVYLGKQPAGPFALSYSPDLVVKRLITPITGSGRNVTMDNWFTSLPLALDLVQDHNLTVLGTVRKNKKELAPIFIETKQRKECSSVFGFQEKNTVLSCVPKREKTVILLSTMHNDDAIDHFTGEKYKPVIITDYNRTKSGVDAVDKLCASYNTSRNSRLWPLTIFFTLLNIAGIDSRVIYTWNNSKNIKRRFFLKQFSLDLISDHMNSRKSNKYLSKGLKRKMVDFMETEDNVSPPKRPNLDQQKRCTT
ncbi:piggyBac transposable element-derived protein 4-like [Sitophilus oryzae]|uniref:PiggyBac transposable element-derived protein 4-like n=1 Tax=Sitophilus oryzae TaxID=7048 RepID=A0A6J2XTN0_SITOR|nr:piggyBac transposable element-derived protein 4-like [Sitophilus oryzae]